MAKLPAVSVAKRARIVTRQSSSAEPPPAAARGERKDVPYFLTASEVLQCDHLTGRTSPAMIDALILARKDPLFVSWLRRLIEKSEAFERSSRERPYYIDFATIIVMSVAAAILLKILLTPPRGTAPTSPAPMPSITLPNEGLDYAVLVQRLAFAHGYAMSKRAEVRPDATAFDRLPTGIPPEYLTKIETGAVPADKASKSAPAATPPAAASAAEIATPEKDLEAPRKLVVKSITARKRYVASPRRTVAKTQVVLRKKPDFAAPGAGKDEQASPASLFEGLPMLFSPAGDVDAKPPSASLKAPSAIFSIGPLEAEAARIGSD